MDGPWEGVWEAIDGLPTLCDLGQIPVMPISHGGFVIMNAKEWAVGVIVYSFSLSSVSKMCHFVSVIL